jgi:hypothetical protein
MNHSIFQNRTWLQKTLINSDCHRSPTLVTLAVRVATNGCVTRTGSGQRQGVCRPMALFGY